MRLNLKSIILDCLAIQFLIRLVFKNIIFLSYLLCFEIGRAAPGKRAEFTSLCWLFVLLWNPISPWNLNSLCSVFTNMFWSLLAWIIRGSLRSSFVSLSWCWSQPSMSLPTEGSWIVEQESYILPCSSSFSRNVSYLLLFTTIFVFIEVGGEGDAVPDWVGSVYLCSSLYYGLI